MIWLETKKRRSQNIFELLIAIAGYYIKDHRIEVKKYRAHKIEENQMPYQLNMFGVAVVGSIPRCISLYNIASK